MATGAAPEPATQKTTLPGNPRKSELRDGMQVDWDVSIPARDGLVLKADVFRPPTKGKYPVIMTYGIYAKGLSYQEGYPLQWNKMVEDYPEILEGSSNKYQNWEVVDPSWRSTDQHGLFRPTG